MQFKIKILICGDSNVGKTTFLNKLNDIPLELINAPTIGVDYQIYIINDNIKLSFWDTGGMERFHSITRNYFRDNDIFLLFFSLSDINSLKNISYWINVIKETNTYENIHNRIILIGTKTDLRKISNNQIKNSKYSKYEYLETTKYDIKTIKAIIPLIQKKIKDLELIEKKILKEKKIVELMEKPTSCMDCCKIS